MHVTCQLRLIWLRSIHSIPLTGLPNEPSLYAGALYRRRAGSRFPNSIGTPVDVEIDWIDNGEGLLAWLEQASLVPAPVLDSFRKRALPGELDAVAAQARSLREWFRGFVARHKGRPLTPEALADIEPLRRLLERDETFIEIVARDHGEGPVLVLNGSVAGVRPNRCCCRPRGHSPGS
ncbi:ABATE domain-containing protein [Paraburkholderia sp. 2C]